MLKVRRLFAASLLSAGVAALVFASAAQAQTQTVLHSFAGATGDGDRPFSDVTFDKDGNLYGTTYSGGASNHGAIYKIAPNGTETLLHSFSGGADGAAPQGGVTIDKATGDLYGVAQSGGNLTVCSGSGCGTLYKLAANGTFSVLHTFGGPPNDGRYPAWGMIRDKKGNLYGVTSAGGSLDDGILFRYGGNGRYKILYSFDSAAAPPVGRLARDGTGNLYGVTGVGGTAHSCSGHGCGAIYRLSPDGTFVLLYSFTNNEDGRYPAGGVTLDKDGNLYGTTQFGGAGGSGTVYRLMPVGTFSTLYSFNGANGSSPAGEVLKVKDDLYLTTVNGGSAGIGTVVKVTVHGIGTTLYEFGGTDGRQPSAGLVKRKGLFYGTTQAGGASGHGVVFSLTKK